MSHASWLAWSPLEPPFSYTFSSEPSDYLHLTHLAHPRSGALHHVGQARILAAGSLGEGTTSDVTTAAPLASQAHLARLGLRLRMASDSRIEPAY